MPLLAFALPLLSLPHGLGLAPEEPKDLQGWYLQRTRDAETRWREAREADQKGEAGPAREAYARTAVAARQAAMLAQRCKTTPVPAPVIRLLFARSTEASARFRSLLRAKGEPEAEIERQARDLNRRADAETQAILARLPNA